MEGMETATETPSQTPPFAAAGDGQSTLSEGIVTRSSAEPGYAMRTIPFTPLKVAVVVELKQGVDFLCHTSETSVTLDAPAPACTIKENGALGSGASATAIRTSAATEGGKSLRLGLGALRDLLAEAPSARRRITEALAELPLSKAAALSPANVSVARRKKSGSVRTLQIGLETELHEDLREVPPSLSTITSPKKGSADRTRMSVASRGAAFAYTRVEEGGAPGRTDVLRRHVNVP
jgi:hypothetical protein